LPKIKVFEAHHWAITDLGKYLKGLAKSRTGYEIIKHKTKNIFGLQFHPEMLDNESAGDEIFRRIISKLFNKDHEIQFD
jgi:gamma-glutamyl-gamma-aminobutyrate hydrolase PuuD